MIDPPSKAEIRELGQRLYLNLNHNEIEFFQKELGEALEVYGTLNKYDRIVPDQQQPKYKRRGGYRSSDDPYNTWISRCEINGADEGPLTGLDIAIKDNICVAGIEMTCGSRVMEGYVPDIDATIVRWLLDSGGRIIGKTNMDDMAFTPEGAPSAFGPIRNPHDDNYLAGGSSGGSATAVATEQADIAIGSDQGGSVRIPAAHCGVVGHKPTHGLVPYTGGIGLEYTIDHYGLLATDIQSVALTLSVIAGKDPYDPRQPADVPVEDYTKALEADVDDLSIGILREGFEHDAADPEVNDRVRTVLDGLEDAGAMCEEVSVPMHDDAFDIHFACLAEGLLGTVDGEGVGRDRSGWFNASWVESFGKFRRSYGDTFPPGVKLTLLLGAYMSETHHSRFYPHAMNLRTKLTEEYNSLFETYDLLAMPTTPQTASEYDPECDYYKMISEKGLIHLRNTCPFNRSGHPAISVPVEPLDGLPVGLMFVGGHFEDGIVLNAGEKTMETT